MRRRTYLRAAGTTGAVLAAGCLGRGSEHAVLGPPGNGVDSEALSYPAYGEALPEATLPSPLHDREVATTEFVGDRNVLLTFVFTRCHGPCPTMTATLAQVQAHAAEHGYGDDVALLPVTFDPEYDTAEKLRTFSEERGADPTAENWQFLRPETHARADAVVNGTFGVGFQKTDAYSPDGDPHGGDTSGDGDGGTGDGSDGSTDDTPDGADGGSGSDDGPEDMFVHLTLVILVNSEGYVERAYRELPQPAAVIDDLQTVREGGGFW